MSSLKQNILNKYNKIIENNNNSLAFKSNYDYPTMNAYLTLFHNPSFNIPDFMNLEHVRLSPQFVGGDTTGKYQLYINNNTTPENFPFTIGGDPYNLTPAPDPDPEPAPQPIKLPSRNLIQTRSSRQLDKLIKDTGANFEFNNVREAQLHNLIRFLKIQNRIDITMNVNDLRQAFRNYYFGSSDVSKTEKLNKLRQRKSDLENYKNTIIPDTTAQSNITLEVEQRIEEINNVISLLET